MAYELSVAGKILTCKIPGKALGDEWLNGCAGPGWCAGCDINQDNKVNLEDFVILASEWLESTP